MSLVAAPPLAFAGTTGQAVSSRIDSLIAEARVAAGEDRHSAAIDLYRRAIEIGPEVRSRVSIDLARQLTWAGRLDESVHELRWYLEGRPKDVDPILLLGLTYSWAGRIEEALDCYRQVLRDHPENLDAAMGEARMLTWAGDLEASQHAYASIEERYPGHVGARLGQAQIINWKGESRRAWRRYEAILWSEPCNGEALEGLATAQNWVGRPDLALMTLKTMRTSGVATGSSLNFENDLRRRVRPRPGTQFDFFDDSQGYTLWSARQDVSVWLTALLSIRPGIAVKHEEHDVDFETDEVWPGCGFQWRLATGLAVRGEASILPSRDPDARYTPLAGHAAVDLFPADGAQISWLYNRQLHTTLNRAVPSPRRDKLAGNSYGFEVTKALHPRLSFSSHYDYTTYHLDGDATAHFRHNGHLKARVAALTGYPRVSVEAGYQHIDFNRYAPIGIWTPDRFQSLQAGIEAQWKPWSSATVRFGLQTGTQREQQLDASGRLAGDWDPFGGFTAFASTDIGRAGFYAGGGHASSSFETGRGYRRTYLFTGLTWGF